MGCADIMAETLLGIGALSRACGIPSETLRTWERRYGFPEPVQRDGSAHRRYPFDAVERLRLIKRVLSQGHKPALVVGADVAALQRLLVLEAGSAPPPPIAGDADPGRTVAALMGAVHELNASKLDQMFAHAWDVRGAMSFLQDIASPFLREVGDQWASGDIQVFEEHFASDRLRGFLSLARQRLPVREGARVAVCAALPNDLHDLGAQMASVVLALNGHSVLFLGANTPVSDIARSAIVSTARFVALSVAAGYPTEDLRSHLVKLVQLVPPETRILLGGDGATVRINGVTHVDNWEILAEQTK